MSFIERTTKTTRADWETPQRFFDELHREFGFTVDVCATQENYKCPKFYTKKENGLSQDWTGEICWMNPPYGRDIGMWVKKAAQSHATVVCLLPCRTDSRWWQLWAMTAHEIRYVRGRLKFRGAKDGAQFPSAIVIFRNGRVRSGDPEGEGKIERP